MDRKPFFLSRRSFISSASCALCSLSIDPRSFFALALSPAHAASAASGRNDGLREVMYYTKLEGQKIECGICPKKCRIADRERGYCGNKENRNGTYYTLVYGTPCAVHVDPIEKKPLFHYLPTSRALSIAAAGCNFECRFCQNWRIAQYRPEQIESIVMPPEAVAAQAVKTSSDTIAYTYSEPVVFYGYMHDCAKEGRKKGIGSVMISNGFINEEPMKAVCRYLTGVKIDLKGFTESFYREQCSGELEGVLSTLKLLKKLDMWTEIVVLIIPTLNDSPEEIHRMTTWIAENLGSDVPLHFSRFHPMYKIKNLPPTPVKTLERCRAIARKAGLHYVYLGNVPGHPAESTCCPRCGKTVIRRMGFAMLDNHIKEGACAFCGAPVAGVWKQPAALQS